MLEQILGWVFFVLCSVLAIWASICMRASHEDRMALLDRMEKQPDRKWDDHKRQFHAVSDLRHTWSLMRRKNPWMLYHLPIQHMARDIQASRE